MARGSVVFVWVAFAMSGGAMAKDPGAVGAVPANAEVELVLTQQQFFPADARQSPVGSAQAGNFYMPVGNMASGADVGANIVGAVIANAILQHGPNKSAEWANAQFNGYDLPSTQPTLQRMVRDAGITATPRIVSAGAPARPVAAQGQCGNPVLRIQPLYWVAGRETITAGIKAVLVDCKLDWRGKPKDTVAWSRGYSFSFSLGHGIPEGEQDTYFASLGKATVHKMLTLANEQAARMLVYDFSAAGKEEAGIEANTMWRKSRLIVEGPNWTWHRYYKGLEILPNLTGTYRVTPDSVKLLTEGDFSANVGKPWADSTDVSAAAAP